MSAWRVLLQLYPREFRDEYGADLVAALNDAFLQERGAARLRFLAFAATDVIVTAAKEHVHLMIRDLIYSCRRTLAHSGMAFIAILSLALGIGANTTMFSIVYSAILRPLPYPESDRLVVIRNTSTRNPANQGPVAAADFIDWRAGSKTLEQWHMFDGGHALTAIGVGMPERIRAQHITPGLLEALGVRPVIGRFIQPGEKSQRLAVIGEHYWQRAFDGRADALGRKLITGGSVHTIVGVAPAGVEIFFAEPSATDFWNAIDLSPGSNWIQRSVPWLGATARLKPGVSIEQARSEMDGLAANLAITYPETNRERGVVLTPALEARNGRMSEFLWPLLGAVGFVLVIACSNVANLLLARAVVRRREIALRAALGASRERLVREFLMDGIVLAIPGVVGGAAVAYGGILLFRALVPAGFPGASLVQLNLPVLGFTAITGALAGIGAALLPALQGAKVDLTDALKEGGRGSGSRTGKHLRSLLVAGEIALSLILLAGAGLMVNTMLRLRHQQLGFDPENVTIAQLHVTGTRYMTDLPKQEIDMRKVEPPVTQFIEHLLGAVRDIPGVRAAALAASVPMGPSTGPDVRVVVAGAGPSARGSGGTALNVITPGYFEALRIPLRHGRFLTERDSLAAPWVAIVNEAFVREFFPGGQALGQVVTLGIGPEDRPREIVGVIGDYKQNSLRSPVRPEIITSHFQQPSVIPGNFQGVRFRSSLVVRTATSRGPSAETLAKIVAGFDKDLPVFAVTPLVTHIASRDSGIRFYTGVLGIFSMIALLLAAIGIFGLVNHSVTDRMHEIGIRASLGASRVQIMWLVVSHGMKLAVAGLAVGVAGALAVTRLLTSMLFEVKPGDPATLLLAAWFILTLTAVTCALPALRATRIHPAIALRME
ncbi:MAG: ABC transporter permease [Bryobacteraceae bacterium]